MQKVAKELIGMAAKDPGTRARLQAALSSTRPVRNNFVPSCSARMLNLFMAFKAFLFFFNTSS
jgi:hypothetical protein